MAGRNQDQVVGAAAGACEEMMEAVHPSFGPSGRALLAQSTSRLTITRSGSQILNLVFTRPSPVHSLLLDSATQLHSVTGDGVKSFVIIVKALLKQAALKNAPSFVNSLLTLQNRLSQSFPSSCGCVLTSDVLENVIKTFFSTRFSPVVSESLAILVFEWVSKLSSINEVDLYVKNFSLLCPKFTPFAVSASCVQGGFLIKGHYVKRFPAVKTRCALKVYYHCSETSVENGDIEVDITEILNNNDNDSKNTLFVTNVVLQDRAQFLLNIKGIFFIHGTCLDTAKFLFEQSLLINTLEVECQCINEYLWISLPVHQLLLKAPSNALASEYAEGVSDCLKMLYVSFKESACTVLAGGLFELCLAKKLFGTVTNNGRRIPPVQCREQLLTWRKTLPVEADILKHLDVTQFEGLDSEAVDTVCRALLTLQTSCDHEQKCLESVGLRLTVMCKALNVTANVCKIRGAISKPKKGRLV